MGNYIDNSKMKKISVKASRCLLLILILATKISHAFLIPSSTTAQSTSKSSVHQVAPLLAVRVSNETEAPQAELAASPKQRISMTGLAAKQALDDDRDFERVTDAKFLERNKRWIVLVDDEEAIRLAVGDYLYDQGYQVTACADADSFLDVCQKTVGLDGGASPQPVPDAIVSDVRMPGKDGLELLGLIRSDARLSRVPVILLTAKGMAADRVAGYQAGANVYLPKPFAPEELLSILDNSIQRRQQMTSNKAGSLIDLKQEMASIKEIMKKNAGGVVKRTNVYLTLVEREVLDLLCNGYTNKEIAEERGVSIIGVNRMIQKLYTVTETETRTELVRWAMKTGYVSKR